MINSMNRLRSHAAAALVAVLGLLVCVAAEEKQAEIIQPPRLKDVGRLGFPAQAAWLGIPQLSGSVDGASKRAGGPEALDGAKLAAAAPAPQPLSAGAVAAQSAIVERELAWAKEMQPKVPAPEAAAGPDAADVAVGSGERAGGGRVSWTERYELGPGDRLNFGLHGQPELSKSQVPVAPDWTISYLQAKQVSVRGLTVEELRGRIEEALSEFHRNPKLILTPATLGSKKYTVLGKVKSNDTYQLDRPTSLIEAIARAKGIVVGVRNTSATELADLKRSFVVRDGDKLPVDLESLYAGGDMTQNIQIEPGDYIYIASNVHNEAYVFGSVAQQGTLPLTGRLTVMGAIAESGGYAKYAWKKRVLLVRGSVGSPDARVIDTKEILRGNEKDLLLEPGDIVYVHKEPWAYAEEILDIAIKAYIQSATAVAIQGDNAVTIGL